MRVFSSLIIITILAAAAAAQHEGKIVASIAGSDSIKNAPFSADAVSDSVQTLFDGNRIVRSSTSKMYRNSEGKMRRELSKGSGLGSFYNFDMPGVTIMDPIGSKFLLDSKLKIATTLAPLPLRELNIVGAGNLTDEQKAQIEKLKTELKLKEGQTLTTDQKVVLEKLHTEFRLTAPKAIISGTGIGSATGAMTAIGATPFAFSFGGPESKYDTKTEDLGTRDIEGVLAEGTRRVTTIPAGAIGNERPIETVYERWYSKDLGVVVMSKNSDPRFGEQTYRLTNIVRAEPDPSLFSVPNGYKVVSGSEGGNNTYYYNVTGAGPAKGSGKGTTVYTTKP